VILFSRLRFHDRLILSDRCEEPAWGPAADQGVRPTDSADIFAEGTAQLFVESKTPFAAYEATVRFLELARKPAVLDPGDDPIPIGADNFKLERRGETATLEVWSETRNLVRRLRAIHSEHRGRLELEVERFGGRMGRLALVDLAHPASRDTSRRGARLKYRERFRRSLLRQFPSWRIAELSTEADLHHSLSPSYPRALLRKGSAALAAIGAAEDALDVDGALTFGLIWLDYLRRRETRIQVNGLTILVPAGKEATTCHRIRYLDASAVNCAVFVHFADGSEEPVNPGDYTNFDTRIEPCRRPLTAGPTQLLDWMEQLAEIENVERRDHADGAVSLAVHGLEFARAEGGRLTFGLDHKIEASTQTHIAEIEALSRGLAERRSARQDHVHPLYARHPEAWLESQVRGDIERVDAALLPRPLYGQVPQFAAGERGMLDILAVDRSGKLCIVEVKASQDIHLPLQALDYWMRVKWHLERGEFAGAGYFPGVELRGDPPRLLLVAPALDFHPSNETVLRFLSREVEVERIGVGIEWRQELRVMFRSPAVVYAHSRSPPGKASAGEPEP
jgi:hypothetical protein